MVGRMEEGELQLKISPRQNLVLGCPALIGGGVNRGLYDKSNLISTTLANDKL